MSAINWTLLDRVVADCEEAVARHMQPLQDFEREIAYSVLIQTFGELTEKLATKEAHRRQKQENGT